MTEPTALTDPLTWGIVNDSLTWGVALASTTAAALAAAIAHRIRADRRPREPLMIRSASVRVDLAESPATRPVAAISGPVRAPLAIGPAPAPAPSAGEGGQ